MKKENKNLGSKIFTLVLILFIAVSSVLNINLLVGALKTSKEKDLTVNETISEIKTTYTSNFKAKDSYINFNGLFGKLSGRTIYNGVVLLNNGMLVDSSVTKPNFDKYSKNVKEFSEYLNESGKEYLYVQAPYKLDTAGELGNVGMDNRANEYADNMLSALKEYGVNTLDLRPYISANADMVEKYYYRTDHHWNTDGAFLGYTKIVDKLRELFPSADIDPTVTDQNNWKRDVYEDVFLGTRGKRVGKYYGGVDDFICYTPKFPTSMSCYVPKHDSFFKGDFSDAVIREDLVSTVDYFGISNYCAYIGGDYPLVQHRNYNASCDLKVLFLKDSYTLPVQSFLSTVFREIEVLDPRHYNDGSIAEYVECYNPDIVIMMVNPSVMATSNYYTYGLDTVKTTGNTTKTDTIVEGKDILIPALENSNFNYKVSKEKLHPNTKYTVSFSDVEVQKGASEIATLALYDAKEARFIKRCGFDIEYCKSNNHFSWTFTTPNNTKNLQLLLYAGNISQTEGNQVLWKGYKLQQHK